MVNNVQLNYQWLLVLLVIPILLWVRYTTSLGKRSQRALAGRVRSLQQETNSPLFVCVYGNEGHGILLLNNDSVSFLNASTELLNLRKSEIINIEYSNLGFCHIITASNRYKFAYIHHAKDANGVYTMVFGPTWHDDSAVEVFENALENMKFPHIKVKHTKLVFLPQIRI